MTSTQKYFIDLLGSFLGKCPLPSAPVDVDWGELKTLAKTHAVAGIIGHMFANAADIPADISQTFRKKAFSTVMVSSAHIALGDRTIAALNEAGIDCTPFKGAVIRKYYPVEELRTFSDIDILVAEEKLEEAHNVMIAQGFSHTDGKVGVRGYNKDGFVFEIHTTLAGDMQDLETEETEFFSAAAESVKGNNICTLKKELHFVYCIWHLVKHLSGSGAGVRMFMDIAVLLDSYGIEDWDEVSFWLSALGITKAACSIFLLCRKMFGTYIPNGFGAEIKESALESALQYILTGGIFGYSARSTGSARLRNQLAADEGASKSRIILNMFFPTAQYVAKLYPWYSGKAIWLPFMWLWRWIHILFTRRKSSLRSLSDVHHGGDKEIAEASLLKAMGWNIYSKK